jgi:hypothetical protein
MGVTTNLLTEDPQYLRLPRAAQFTWGAITASTLNVYREAAERREHRRK